ncbi:glycosyltransferase family A protein [Helicobacter pametensis]|nr:glycosyltransferase family A protein [Helicobacter pametensis]
MISKFPKVAIIVPIYNVENYLERCLQSLQKQTHQNLLIVLINDGSTDQSKEIAQRYVQTDSRFMLIDQQNGGLSHARNKGLSFLEGKLSSSYPPPPIEIDFLSFVDSDDYLECDCIEKSLLELQRHQAQIVCFGINRCEENGAKIRSDFGIFEQVSKNQVLDGAEVLKQTRKNYFHSV